MHKDTPNIVRTLLNGDITMTKIKIILSLLLLTLSVESTAAIKAFLDRQSVSEGDIVKLTFEADFEPKSQPDFAVLEKDFIIKSTFRGVRYESINGRSSHYNTWTLSLQPKLKGQFQIPEIQFDQQKSNALKLSVTEVSPEQLKKTSESVFIEMELGIDSKDSVYIQQQVPLIVRLYSDDSVQEGDIHMGVLDNGTIEQLTQDKQYTVTRNNKNFNVLERRYIIAADKSGVLTVPAPLFKGRQLEKNKNNRAQSQYGSDIFNDPFFRGSLFGQMFGGITRPISVRGKPTTLTIKPVPSEFKGKEWLPAEDLVIIDSWTNQQPHFKVGEPTTRTLTVQAAGLLGTQTPELPLGDLPKIQSYKDQAQTKTKTDGIKVFGIRTQDITYIPSAEGRMTIPGFSIEWWNVKEGKAEQFVLPDRVINIAAGSAMTTQGSSNTSTPQLKTQGIVEQPNTAPISNVSQEESTDWLNIFLWGVLFLLLAMLAKLLMKPKTKSSVEKSKLSNPVKLSSARLKKSEILKKLQQACEQNNNKQAAHYLIALAEIEWPEEKLVSVGAIAANLSNAEAIWELDKSLYAPQQSTWQGGNKLWQRVKNGLQEVKAKPEDSSGLLALYP